MIQRKFKKLKPIRDDIFFFQKDVCELDVSLGCFWVKSNKKWLRQQGALLALISGRGVSGAAGFVVQHDHQRTLVVSFFPPPSASGWLAVSHFPCIAIGWLLPQLGTPHVTPKSLKRQGSHTWVTPLRGRPFQKPHPADFPQQPEVGHRSIPKSVAAQGDKNRSVRTHLWARRESPDVPCTLLLIPEQNHSPLARTKDGAGGSAVGLGDNPTMRT